MQSGTGALLRTLMSLILNGTPLVGDGRGQRAGPVVVAPRSLTQLRTSDRNTPQWVSGRQHWVVGTGQEKCDARGLS